MKYYFLSILLTSSHLLFAQTDTLNIDNIELQPVEVKQYFSKQSILQLTNSAHTISRSTLQSQSPVTITSAINTVAGIRMEERSPGSYRIGMRGSLIRSPFGIRNTKIYIDEFPLTDAGGNTYLNLLDPNSLEALHIIKGPDGSLFGANSGGVIRITPYGYSNTKNTVDLQLSAGSFGLFQQNLGINQKVTDKYNLAFNQSYLTSEGYRDHSAFRRKTLQTTHQYQYNSKGSLKLFALYTDLDYQTPGGLTLKQYEENPKAARPAAGPNPSAEEQQAKIYNKTFYGGLSHDYQITNKLSHFVSIFGSHTDFENPFITNYEYRTEKNLGARTFLSYQDNKKSIPFQFQIGLEAQNGWNKIDNFDNNKGSAGDTQAKDILDNQQLNFFSRAQIDLTKDWMFEASLGLNKNSIKYEILYPTENANRGDITFEDVWMPRIATSYQLANTMALRASISKGYSTPTLAEVRSSDNTINTNLLAESGVNYELGYKIQGINKRWLLDLSIYQYNMDNGIVRNLNDAGVEFYANAGEMKQKGAELSFWSFYEFNNSFVKSIQYNTSASYNHYRFGDYTNGATNFKGNKITSVPDWTLSNSLSLVFPKQFQLNIYHNHTSTIPLDDANTFFSDSYDLIQVKLNWSTHVPNLHSKLTFFVGIDNALNQKYSLGNDINAFGGRFYNAAANRNYYTGLKISF
jgi:iron complex outermembrane receptor protein